MAGFKANLTGWFCPTPDIMSMIAIGSGKYYFLWTGIVIYATAILFLTLISILFSGQEEGVRLSQSSFRRVIQKFVKTVGNARVMFSITFFYGLLEFNEFPLIEARYFWFIVIWAFILVWEPLGIGLKFESLILLFGKIKIQEEVGVIVRSKSPDLVYCQLHEDISLSSNDLVKILLKGTSSKDLYGIVINIFFLDDKNWANIRIFSDLPSANLGSLFGKSGIIIKVSYDDLDFSIKQILKDSNIYQNRNKIVGIIDTNSNVNQIKVQVINRSLDLRVGRVLYCTSYKGEAIYYQIGGGFTQEENLEEANKFGFVSAYANQLGIWDDKNLFFRKFDWVPELNTVVFLYDATPNPDSKQLKDDNCALIGHIPNSDFPVYAIMDELIPHHYSVLGITGCGKSTFEIDLIQKKINLGYKVLCFDITGDYAAIFDELDLEHESFYSKEVLDLLEPNIKNLEKEYGKWPDKRQYKSIDEWEDDLKKHIHQCVETIYKSECLLYIVEIEEIANTTMIHDLFQRTLREIFDYKKKTNDSRILSIVFEEAHTIIPERSSSTFDYRDADRIVNRIAQITLQGRKYNIGFSIITQRTANVSKTILNQCNTTFSFACYDKTAKEFLANYYGEEYANILPNLAKYQLLVAGKAINSMLPVIVQLPIKEKVVDINTARKTHRKKLQSIEEDSIVTTESAVDNSEDDDLPF